MDNSLVFLLGTSRAKGNTRQLVDALNKGHDAPVIELSSLNISHYDYDHGNQADDFLPTIEKLVTYKTIVFATPVYWYAMSAQLKTFFDRFSDLIRNRKDLGRRLAGRNTYLVATGTDKELPPGFEEPFRLTSGYLSMHYQGALYNYIEEDLEFDPGSHEATQKFSKELFSGGAVPEAN